MKRSRYIYPFETDTEYVLYSWLANDYIAFPLKEKQRVVTLLNNPDDVITNYDVEIYKKLLEKKALISDQFDEFDYLLILHNKAIYRNDSLALTIMPTLNCNCCCPYCYEVHDNERLSTQVIENMKQYITQNLDGLHYLHISWFGGEPLLEIDTIKTFSEFCRRICIQNNITFTANITSNAVLLNEAVAKILTENDVRNFCATLDGSKRMHDQTRITKKQEDTFDKIVTNLINFIKLSMENRVILRIHVHSFDEDEIAGIIESLKLFGNYASRVSVYFRTLFSSCTDRWKVSEISEPSSDSLLTKNNIIAELISKSFKMGFGVAELAKRSFFYCEAELDNYWTVKPDGSLSKCTIAVEKERSLAKFTDKGLKIDMDRMILWNVKNTTNRLTRCKGCNVFPFCWGLCAYSNYQNHEEKDLNILCESMKNSNIIAEQMSIRKNLYQTIARG